MIFTSKKKKIAKAIQQATIVVVTDEILVNECKNMTSKKGASSILGLEVMIQRIYALVFVFNIKYHPKYNWATLDFVLTNIRHIFQYELEDKYFYPIILKGFNRLMNIEGDGPERINKLYDSSAQIVLEHDNDLSHSNLIKFIEKNVQSYILEIEKYFN